MVAGRRPPDKTGFYVFTCLSCGGEDRRKHHRPYCIVVARRSKKLSGFLFAVARRRPIFPPVRATFLFLWPAAEPILIFFLVQEEDPSDFLLQGDEGWAHHSFKGTIRNFVLLLSGASLRSTALVLLPDPHFPCQCPFKL
jgi:hypothetical protein